MQKSIYFFKYDLVQVVATFITAIILGCPAMASYPKCISLFSATPTSTTLLTRTQEFNKKRFETVFDSLYKNSWSTEFRTNKFGDTVHIYADPTEGREKIKILKQLGFKFFDDKVEAPNFSTFLKNYLSLMDLMQVPVDRRILPALVFAKKVDGVFKFELVTPGIDPWPTDPDFYLINAATTFNLPYETVLAAMQRGRFPLMDAAHDVFHYVGFLKDPQYMITIRNVVEKIKNPRPVKNFDIRINLLVESLTLAHPQKRLEIENLLVTPKLNSNKAEIPFAQFHTSISSLSDNDLKSHARSLLLDYGLLLKDYGGSVNRSSEKLSLIGAKDQTDLGMILYPEISLRNTDRSSREEPGNFGIMLKDLLKIFEMSDAELTQYLNHYNFFQFRERYSFLFKPGQDILNRSSNVVLDVTPQARLFFKEHLSLYMARMEFFMWRSLNDMTPERIINGMLHPDGSFDPAVADFLRDSLGANSNFHQVLRPEGLTLKNR